MSENLYRRAVKSSLFLASANYTGYALTILAQLVLARLLTPHNYGTFALALSFAEILSQFLNLQFSFSCILYQNEEGIFDTAFSIAMMLTLVQLLITLVLYFYFNNHLLVRLTLILLFFRFLLNPFTILSAKLEKDILYGRIAVTTVFSKILSLILGVSFALLKGGVYSLVIMDAAMNLFLAISYCLISRHKFIFNCNVTIIIKLIKYTFNMWGNRLLEILLQRLPNIFIKLISGNTILIGLLDRSLYLAGLPSTVTSPFHTRVSFSFLVKISNNNEQITNILNSLLWFVIRVVVPFSIILYFYSDQVILSLLGKNWLSAVVIIKSLSIYASSFLIFNVFKQLFFSKNKVKFILYLQVFQIVFLLLGIYIILKLKLHWQYIGMLYSFASVLSVLILFILTRFYFKIILAIRKLFFIPIIYIAIIIIEHLFVRISVFSLHFLFDLFIYFVLVILFEGNKIKEFYYMLKKKNFES